MVFDTQLFFFPRRRRCHLRIRRRRHHHRRRRLFIALLTPPSDFEQKGKRKALFGGATGDTFYGEPAAGRIFGTEGGKSSRASMEPIVHIYPSLATQEFFTNLKNNLN